MLVVGFDTETTGLDTSNDKIIEVGAVLWDTERAAPMRVFSHLLKVPEGVKLDAKITELTGISDEDLAVFGEPAKAVLEATEEFLGLGEFVVAHNGNLFDKPIYKSNLESYGIAMIERPWIDTSCDIEFPSDMTTRRLKHLASEHHFLNPFAHRAIFDVLTMLKVAQHYDWSQIVTYSKAPTITIRANTDYHQRELAKKQSFRWDGDNKVWKKSIKDFQLEAAQNAAKEAGFTIAIIG